MVIKADLLDKDFERKLTIFSKVNTLEDGYVMELAEYWDSEVVDYNPRLFEPLRLVHVAQGMRGCDSSVKGNCRKYHELMGEIPCTPLDVCKLRDKFRDAQDKEAERLEKEIKKFSVSEKEQARVKRYKNEQERFTNWCKDMGWGDY